MALVRCRECRQQISSSAKRCPACGKSVQTGTGLSALAAVITGSALLLIVLTATRETGLTDNKTLAVAETSPPATSAPAHQTAEQDLEKLVAFHISIAKCQTLLNGFIKKYSGPYGNPVDAYEGWQNKKIAISLMMLAAPGEAPDCRTGAPEFSVKELNDLTKSIGDGVWLRRDIEENICERTMRAIDVGVMPPSQSVITRQQQARIKELRKKERESFEKAYDLLGVGVDRVDWKIGGLAGLP